MAGAGRAHIRVVHRAIRTAVLAALVAVPAALGAIGNDARAQNDEERRPAVPECIEHRSEARYRALGYDHVVVLTSRCEHVARCTVTTDVNPQPARVNVRPGTTEEVVTWRSSPARAFTATLACELER